MSQKRMVSQDQLRVVGLVLFTSLVIFGLLGNSLESSITGFVVDEEIENIGDVDTVLKEGDNYFIITAAVKGKTRDEIAYSCEGKIEEFGYAQVGNNNYQPIDTLKTDFPPLKLRVRIREGSIRDGSGTCTLRNPTISMHVNKGGRTIIVIPDMIGKTFAQRKGTCTDSSNYQLKKKGSNLWVKLEENDIFKEVGDSIYLNVLNREGCIFNLPATSQILGDSTIVNTQSPAPQESQISPTIIRTEKVYEDKIHLITGWNLISVTEPMNGRSIEQISNVRSLPQSNRCESSQAWILYNNEWLQIKPWMTIEPTLESEKFRYLVYNNNLKYDEESFNSDLLGLGLYLFINNPNGCILGCGLSDCSQGVS